MENIIILSALAGIAALSLAACGTAAEDVQTTADAAQAEAAECHCPTKWQHACCEYLNNLDFLAGGIYFGDINCSLTRKMRKVQKREKNREIYKKAIKTA